jgi:WD40 repeat protein
MNRSLGAGLIIIIVLVIFDAALASPPTRLEPQHVISAAKLTLLMTLPKDSILKSDPVFSLDGSQAVARYSHGEKSLVMINGKEISSYEEVRDLSFDQQNALSFAGLRDGLWHPVTGDYEGKGYESIVCLGVFAGGKDIWWMADTGKNDTYTLIRNRNEVGKPIRHYKAIFSPDRKHLAVTGFREDTAVIFVDGVERILENNIDDFDFDAHQPYFDKEGTLHFLKTNRESESNFVEFNDKKHSVYMFVGSPVVSPDGKQVAYSAGNDPEQGFMMVRNGNEGKRYRNIKGPLFSPDSTKLAYIVQNKQSGHNKSKNDREMRESYAVVLNEKKERDYADVRKLTFSPDSSQLAYIAANNKGGHFIVINGKEGKSYEEIADLTFSPDSRHYAFRAHADARWFVVVDGQEGESFHWVGAPVFSADSRHLKYGARGGITLLKDAQGRILAYPVRKEGEESYSELQVDGRGLTYAGHKGDERLWTTTDGWLYTSRNEDELYWVDETVDPLPVDAVKKSDITKSDPQVTFVHMAPGAKPLPFGMSYADPDVTTGKYDSFEMPGLFTFVRKESDAKKGNSAPADEDDYAMVPQKFDLREIPFTPDEMDFE